MTTRMKPLPPYGRDIVAQLGRQARPTFFCGSLIVALDWSIYKDHPRIVLPREDDPSGYYLGFLAGLDLVVMHRPWHPERHVQLARAALEAVRPKVLAVVPLPRK